MAPFSSNLLEKACGVWLGFGLPISCQNHNFYYKAGSKAGLIARDDLSVNGRAQHVTTTARRGTKPGVVLIVSSTLCRYVNTGRNALSCETMMADRTVLFFRVV